MGDTAATARRRSEPQIGAELFISARTASVRVSNILAKLGVTSRGEAAAAAHRLRLLHPAPEPLQQLVVILGREPQIGPKALPAGEQI
jgi:Bacterial regulatory proteins, luxR family